MPNTVNISLQEFAFVDSANPASRITGQATQQIVFTRDTAMLMHFQRIDPSLKFRPIISVTPHFYVVSRTGNPSSRAFAFSSQSFDPSSVNYYSKPEQDGQADGSCPWWGFLSDPGWNNAQPWGISISAEEESAQGAAILKAQTIWPIEFYNRVGSPVTDYEKAVIKISNAFDDFPYLEVEYGDSDLHGTPVAQRPVDEYANPHAVIRFSWALENLNTLSCVGDFSPSPSVAPVLSWRVSGSTVWNTVNGTAGNGYIDLPAETLPTGTIEWKVSAADESGLLIESEVATFNTTDTTTYAIPSSPVSSVEDGSSPIKLTWAANNDYGNAPGSSELQYSTDGGTNWTALATVAGPATEYTAAANTFAVGQILWRVRAYNLDNVAGPWAEATFISFAAPAAPSVQSDAVPFATITWQSAGQEAYQLELDGVLLGTFFGYGRQYKLKTPLKDGSHVVRVRVQNVYGLWSPYGEASFNIANDPGEEITLEGSFAVDAALSWSSAELTADFLIFRDGALIGHTAGDRFTDRFVLGSHSYYVINRLPSGNYSRSNTVEGKLCTRRPLIALLSGGEWLPLRYSERSMTQQSFTWTKTHSLRHIAGATFPLLELSPYEDLSGAYDAAFLCAQDAERFYRLRGQVVILKSKDGKVLIGAITSITAVVNTFYQACQFTLEQIQWEDYVDDADG